MLWNDNQFHFQTMFATVHIVFDEVRKSQSTSANPNNNNRTKFQSFQSGLIKIHGVRQSLLNDSSDVKVPCCQQFVCFHAHFYTLFEGYLELSVYFKDFQQCLLLELIWLHFLLSYCGKIIGGGLIISM